MATLLVFIILFIFWLDNSSGFGFSKVTGLGSGFSLSNLAILILFIGWIYSVKKQKTLLNLNNVNILLILFGMFIILSLLFEILSYDYLTDKAQFNLLKNQVAALKRYFEPWIVFFFLSSIINSKKTCEISIIGLISLMILTILTGFAGQSSTGRYSGFEVNQYASFLVLILPMVFSYIIIHETVYKKIAFVIVFLIGFMGLIVSVSRGGYIGFLFSGIAFFLMVIKYKIPNGFKTLGLIVVITVFSGLFTYIAIPNDVREAFRYKVFDIADQEKQFNPYEPIDRYNRSFIEKYSTGRIAGWSNAIELFKESPVWGHGYYKTMVILHANPHNHYLHILVKYGLIGLFLFMMIYFRIYLNLLYYIKNTSNKNSRLIYIGYLSGFAGYMVCMSGVDMYTTRYIFWIYTAIILNYSQIEASKNSWDSI